MMEMPVTEMGKSKFGGERDKLEIHIRYPRSDVKYTPGYESGVQKRGPNINLRMISI